MCSSHPNDFLGPRLGCEHGQDACATAHIQHNLVLEQVLVVEHGVSVGEGADFILQHLLQTGRQKGKCETGEHSKRFICQRSRVNLVF